MAKAGVGHMSDSPAPGAGGAAGCRGHVRRSAAPAPWRNLNRFPARFVYGKPFAKVVPLLLSSVGATRAQPRGDLVGAVRVVRPLPVHLAGFGARLADGSGIGGSVVPVDCRWPGRSDRLHLLLGAGRSQGVLHLQGRQPVRFLRCEGAGRVR